MLFQEILDEKFLSIGAQFDLLHKLAAEKQTDPSDLLLIHENGFYNPNVLQWDNIKEKLSPYVIGPNDEGHAEVTHYDFITDYVNNNITTQSHEDYLRACEFDHNRIIQTDELAKKEAISIQTEMLIYLKIWESDMFIKKLYQLVLLANQEPYDWHFKISKEKNQPNTTGTRSKIIRENIRDKCKKDIPLLAESISIAYTPQVRNAIAHSQYAILGRSIMLLNFGEDKYSTIRSISFDEWIDRFHETLMIYSCYYKLMKILDLNYGRIATSNGGCLEIRVNRKFPTEAIEYVPLYYREVFKDWGFYPDKY